MYTFFRDKVFSVPHQAFLGAGLIWLVFLGLLVLNAWRRRFWCRYICPLGAMLGLFSRWPLLVRSTNREKCNECDLCGMSCHGAAAESAGLAWKASECFGCLNCTEACRRDGLAFAMNAKPEPAVAKVDLSKRAMFGSAIGGLIAMAMLRTTPQARGRTYNPQLIRPPGSREERDFLARCTACGMCLKICPTGGLQPTLTEAGLEGLWTPRLVPKIGYCDYDCNLCGQVCPTAAIEQLRIQKKTDTRIGLASFDLTRCMPYAYGRECMVCEECCPIPDKAIYFLEVEVSGRDGGKKTIRQPHVDPAKCIGCGMCEYMCPFKDRPGIYITSANESRHPENQPILSGDGPY